MALPQENFEKIQQGIRLVLEGLGEDPDREGLKETPLRVAKMYDDVLDGKFIDPVEYTSFKEEHYEGAVIVHHVPFYAFCEHHMAVFNGHFAMAYIPKEKVLGLSKLVRIFRVGCKRLTIQERITEQAVDLMMKEAEPKGAICYVAAEHTCMSLRGVKSPGSITSTFAYRGVYESSVELRQQFLNIAQNGR